MNDLNIWKSKVSQAVFPASADDDLQAWKEWLKPALDRDPDMETLSDSGGQKFQSIDAKLSLALQKIMEGAREDARSVVMKLRLMIQKRGQDGGFVLGREILAMIVMCFRTTSRDDALFNAENLHSLKYLEDSKLDLFYQRWREILQNMKPMDVPSDSTLRDYCTTRYNIQRRWSWKCANTSCWTKVMKTM